MELIFICVLTAIQMGWMVFSFLEMEKQGRALRDLRDETTGQDSLGRQALSTAVACERSINEGVSMAHEAIKRRIEALEAPKP